MIDLETVRQIELEEIELEEIEPFFSSLSTELKCFGVSVAEILKKSVYIRGVRVNGELAAVGSLRKFAWRLLLSTYMVKSEFQRRGIGNDLTRSFVRFSIRGRIPIILATVRKANAPMLTMTQRHGYRICNDLGDNYCMYLPLDWRGKLLGKFLPMLVGVYYSRLWKSLSLLLRRFHRSTVNGGGLRMTPSRLLFFSWQNNTKSISYSDKKEFIERLSLKWGQRVNACFISQSEISALRITRREFDKVRFIHMPNFHWFPRPLCNLFFFIASFWALITEREHDIFIADNVTITGFMVSLVCKLFRKKSMMTVHGLWREEMDVTYTKGTWRCRINKLVNHITERLALSWCNMIVVNDARFIESFVAKGVEPRRLHTKYVCADTGKFSRDNLDVGKLQEVRSLYKLPDSYILYVGRLIPWDGIDDFLETFKRIRRELPQVKSVIIGEGPLKAAVERLSRENGFEDSVLQTDKVEHELMPYFYYGAQAVLLPMKPPQSGVGRITLEALAMQVPVVTTDVGVLGEAVLHGETGYLCTVGDSATMAAYTVSLLQDRQLASEMGKRGRALVKRKFDVDKYIDNWAESLQGLLNDRISYLAIGKPDRL